MRRKRVRNDTLIATTNEQYERFALLYLQLPLVQKQTPACKAVESLCFLFQLPVQCPFYLCNMADFTILFDVYALPFSATWPAARLPLTPPLPPTSLAVI